jgi:aspartyl aminopeptidase
MCTRSFQALAEACEDGAWLAEEPNVQMVVCFDNEEVGSQSQYGAMSNLLPRAIERIVNDANPEVVCLKETVSGSLLANAAKFCGVEPGGHCVRFSGYIMGIRVKVWPFFVVLFF